MTNAFRESIISEMMDLAISEQNVQSLIEIGRAACNEEGIEAPDSMIVAAVSEYMAFHLRPTIEREVDERLSRLPWYHNYEVGQAALDAGFVSVKDDGEIEFTPLGFFVKCGRIAYSNTDLQSEALETFNKLLEDAHRRGFRHVTELRRAFALEIDPLKDPALREFCLQAVAAIGNHTAPGSTN